MANSLSVQRILSLLSEAPSRIAVFTTGLTSVQLSAAPAPGEWSANDVLAHLRSCADVWGNSIAIILDEPTPTIKAINPRTWIERTDYLELAFQPSFEVYAAQRAALLAVLERLSAEEWARAATITGAGKPYLKTALTYAEVLATHERSHVRQIQRIADSLRP
jgi:hypothetical protein